MVWLILLVAVAALGVAAFASVGRLGEMPPPVDDSYAGRVPNELTIETLDQLRFGRAANGYDPGEVDTHLAALLSDAPDEEGADEPIFRVVRGGYRMSQVDAVIDRIARMRNNRFELCREETRESNGSDEATHR